MEPINEQAPVLQPEVVNPPTETPVKPAEAPKEPKVELAPIPDYVPVDVDFGIPSMYSKMPTQPTIYSGAARIKAILENPSAYMDKLETVGGWARTVRKQKPKNEDGTAGEQLVFVELNDGSCLGSLQIVVQEQIGKESFDDILKTTTAACIRFTGTLIKSIAAGQELEMVINDSSKHIATVLGHNTKPGTYPLSKKAHNMETLRQSLHIRPRSSIIGASMRLRNSISFATHLFFQAMGFYYIHTPIITCSDCEGAGEMFGVTHIVNKEGNKDELPVQKKKKNLIDFGKDFFARRTFLTVSGQLNVEPFACSMGNVYTFGPTFRAEQSLTSRHLAEFWMIEPEIAFGGMDENMKCVEDYIKYCIDYCLKNNLDDLQFCNKQNFRGKKGFDLVQYLQGILTSTFRRMTYTEGVEILQQAEKDGHVFEIPVVWGMDLKSEHERYLCEVIVKGPLFLINYPKTIKPFYMKVNEDGKTVGGMDLLVPLIGEVVGGSVREENFDVLMSRMKECGVDPKDYEFYSDLRKYGTVPHCGFGVGLERLIMMISAIDNIKDVIPYPRYYQFIQA